MQRQLIRFVSNMQGQGKVETQLQYWSQQLHDLSGRNRLLYYRDTKASSATILEPEFFELFRMLVEKGSTLRVPIPSLADIRRAVRPEGGEPRKLDDAEVLLPETADEAETRQTSGSQPEVGEHSAAMTEATAEDNPESKPARSGGGNKSRSKRVAPPLKTNHSVPHLNEVMYNLHYAARTVQEEQGFNILYVTFGMLRWRDLRSPSFSQAPVVLVPIRLERGHPGSPYTIRLAEEDIVLNPALQIKVSKDFGFELPEVGNDLTRAGLEQVLQEVRERTQELEGWEVEEKATVGAFNFVTQLLIKDFEKNALLYAQHPLVRWLSGLEPSADAAEMEIPEADQLDDAVDPSGVFQVLDADSSQQEAIEAAKRGLSFVLQGPPGTGKSQTIANLIAESIMAGKRVLFVSQKMAALEVVQNRLRRKGLADFCLEIHSHRMDKRKVIQDLMSTLSDRALKVRNPEHGMKQREIREIRDELNAYVRQLHEPELALGLSLYELYGRLARYLDEADLIFAIEDVGAIGSSELAKRQALVRELAGYRDLINADVENPWRAWKGTQGRLEDRERIAQNLRATGSAIAAVHQGICAIAARYGLHRPETIGEDLQFMQVLACFKSEIFSAALQGAIGRYKVKDLPDGRAFSLQYGEDSRKISGAYRDRRQFTAGEVSEALTIAAKIAGKGRQGEPVQAASDVDDEAQYSSLRRDLERFQTGQRDLRALFDPEEMPEPVRTLSEAPPEEAATWLSDLAEHTGELADWASFNSVKELSEASGLGPFVKTALAAGLPAEQWEGAFTKRFYRLCIELVLRDRPLLQRFRGSSHSDLVRRFRQLDLATIEMSSSRIRAELAERKPHWSWMKAKSAETSILRREFNKKRGLKPLRKLFAEIPGLIQATKPCLMMSPLTVCQLLDPRIHEFDLAVFDEASQIPPEYAVSAFLRAKQVIVAGDSQQLPPMNFFQTMEGDETDDDDQTDSQFESILSLCDSRGFPSKMLNWHYRSRDESLIAYSNFHFYDNRLYTFPSPSRDNPRTGLKYLFVADGVYHGGEGARNNPNEARRVAELLFEHLRTTPELTAGIVTFSVPQRRAVEREIERLRTKNRELDALFRYDVQEPVFVKNLENVQGDERDVIILSVGYGRDEAGKTALNFGPLNRDGGARRLNVAVTRARRLVYLVSSMQPEDINLDRASSQGARLLRSYLATARDGVGALYPVDDEENADADSPFEESVYSELTKRGLELAKRVGASQYRVEMAIKDPDKSGRYVLGLESDGEMYRSGLTARDRDRLREQVLQGLGWKMHRIWSRDWVENRESEISKVLAELGQPQGADEPQPQNAAEERATWPSRERARPAPQAGGDPAAVARLPEKAVPYAPGELQKPQHPGMKALLNAPLSQLIDAFQVLANNEGPISMTTAKTLVVRAWETRRVAAVEERLDLAVKRGAEQGAYVLNGNFLWPLGRQVAPLRVHVAGQPVRKIDEIAPEEIELAVTECVKAAVTIRREDLIGETAKLFGLRNTPENASPIDGAIKAMLARRALEQEAGKIKQGRES